MEELSLCERLSLGRFFTKDNLGICLPTILTIVCIIVLFVLFVTESYDPESLPPTLWDDPFFQGLYPNDSICEEPDLDSFIRQPAAAFAACAYAGMGILCIGFSLYDMSKSAKEKLLRKNSVTDLEDVSPVLLLRQPLWSLLFGLHFLFLAGTGFLYHASITVFAYRLDDYAWWVVDIFFVVYALARLVSDGIPSDRNLCGDGCGIFCVVECHPTAKRFGAFLFFLVCLLVITAADMAMFVYIDQLKEDIDGIEVVGYVVLAVVLFLAVTLHWFFRRTDVDSHWPYFVSGLGVFGLGYAFKWFDEQGGFICMPESFFQGHAVWQALSALAYFLVYMFFRCDVWKDELLWIPENVEVLSMNKNRMSVRGPGGEITNLRRTSVSGRSKRLSQRSQQSEDSMLSVERRATGIVAPELVQATRNIGRRSSTHRHSARESVGSGGARSSLPRRSLRTSFSSASQRRSSMTNGGSSNPETARSSLSRPMSRNMRLSVQQRLQELKDQKRAIEERSRQVRRSLREKERIYEMADVQVPIVLDGRSEVSADTQTIAMWTCARCGETENELVEETCTSCNARRPPLANMVAVAQPLDDRSSQGSRSVDRQPSFAFQERSSRRVSGRSSRSKRSSQRSNTNSRRSNRF